MIMEVAFLAIYIPEDKISEIKNSADIVEIVSEKVLLKKSGRNFLGLCPFHTEKTPSFTVSFEKQIFHCFGCGTGGNVFTFLMKTEGFSFPEAVKHLARRYGIEIPEPQMSAEQKKAISLKERILTLNRKAAVFFRDTLWESPGGKKGIEYLSRRGLTKETINRFGMGFAAQGWDHLLRFFQRQRISPDIVEKAGFILPRKNGSGFYDRFRNRIIFPIINVNKQVIGFGGRVLDDSLPKYMNSPETPVFNKSRSLFGINRAKSEIRSKKAVYIVEGYFDVITLHQYGICNTIATLGTSLTQEHIQLIRGHIGKSGKVFLVFDSDEAGIKAARRSLKLFEKSFVDAHIIILPPGYDPDSYLVKFGKARFDEIASQALAIMPFLMASAVKKYGLSIEGKIRILSDLKQSLAAIDDGVARSLYIKELAEKIDVDEAAVINKVNEVSSLKVSERGLHADRSKMALSDQDGMPDEENRFRRVIFSEECRLERKIVTMMLQYPRILQEIVSRNAIEYFENADLKAIGKIILKQSGDTDDLTSDVMTVVDGDLKRRIISSLALRDEAWNETGCIRLINQFVEIRRYQKNKHFIEKQIKAAEEQNDQDLLIRLLNEKQKMAMLSEKEKMAMLNRD
jgi:DNA primase